MPVTKGVPQRVIAIGVQLEENESQRRPEAPHLIDWPQIGFRARVAGNEGTLENAQSSEGLQESQKIRRLQVMINMVMSVISQDPNLTVEEASELVAGTKRAALAMFPDKELAYDIIYKPRLQRLMRERFHLQ
jgi:hypothetical protein